MDRVYALRAWIESRRDIWLDLIRVYLGIGLFMKGIEFIAHGSYLMERMGEAKVSFAAGLVGHYVVIAHLAGGIMLAFGLLTRLAAAIQIPVLLGAVILVHAREGLFTSAQTLEFTLLVLFLLAIFVVSGGGRLSLDYHIAMNAPEEGKSSPDEEELSPDTTASPKPHSSEL